MQKELENSIQKHTHERYCLQFNKYLINSKTGSSNTCIPFKTTANVKYKMQQKPSTWKMTYFLSPHAPRTQAIAGNTFAGNTPRGISKRKYVGVRRPASTVYMLFCPCNSYVYPVVMMVSCVLIDRLQCIFLSAPLPGFQRFKIAFLTECRATSEFLFFMCQNLLKNKVQWKNTIGTFVIQRDVNKWPCIL